METKEGAKKQNGDTKTRHRPPPSLSSDRVDQRV